MRAHERRVTPGVSHPAKPPGVDEDSATTAGQQGSTIYVVLDNGSDVGKLRVLEEERGRVVGKERCLDGQPGVSHQHVGQDQGADSLTGAKGLFRVT